MSTTRLANIGPAGRRQRRMLGLAGLAAGIAILVFLSRAGASRWWRLGLCPVWLFAGLGFLQAQARTCVALAAQGACDAEIGRRLDDTEIRTLSRQARAVWARTIVVAAALTLAALAFP